jgi:hypothetical protein
MATVRVREEDAAAIPDRRQRRDRRSVRDRRSDLDGAYNDGVGPSPLSILAAIRLYGSVVWIVITSAIGTIFVLKAAWRYVSVLMGHS